MKDSNIIIKNKKAAFDYEFIERYTAGIQLFGTEIKSIRGGKAGLSDTYCTFINDELWVRNMYIAEYFFGTFNNHEIRRDRKLLLTKKELKKLARATKESGLTIIPYELYLDENGRAKLKIALAKGKRQYDKRHSLKEREDKRDMERMRKV